MIIGSEEAGGKPEQESQKKPGYSGQDYGTVWKHHAQYANTFPIRPEELQVAGLKDIPGGWGIQTHAPSRLDLVACL